MLVAAATMAACIGLTGASIGAGAVAANTSTSASGTLTWALGSNPTSLWAPYYWSNSGGTFMSLVQQTMLAFGTYGQLNNQLVSSWKAVNPTTYVYNVASGVRFSDGKPLTAKDVAFSFGIHLNKKVGSQLATYFFNVQSISSKGNQVIVRLKKPDSTWQFIPATLAGFVFERASYLRNVANYGTPGGLPIGTGPYKYASFQPNQSITMVRNPYWKGTKYPWTKIVFPIIPDAQARLLALQSGQVDGTLDVPSAGLGTWINAGNVVVHTFPSAGWRGFSVDMEDGPFQDIHVRKAIAYAIDRVGLTKALLAGTGQPLKCMIPPSMFKAVLPSKLVDQTLAKINGYDFDLSKAKAELKQSKYPNGFSTTLNVPADSAAAIAISQSVQSTLKQIGITVNLNLMPGGPRFQIILDHKPHLGLQILGMGPDYPSPVDYPSILALSSQAVAGGQNSSNWKNSTVDKLIGQAQATTNQVVAARNMLKVCQLESQQASYLPVFTFPYVGATRKGMRLASSIGPYYYSVIWLKYVRQG
jgi:peptide/nickel transport system substrate-binding protein